MPFEIHTPPTLEMLREQGLPETSWVYASTRPLHASWCKIANLTIVHLPIAPPNIYSSYAIVPERLASGIVEDYELDDISRPLIGEHRRDQTILHRTGRTYAEHVDVDMLTEKEGVMHGRCIARTLPHAVILLREGVWELHG